MGWRRMKERRGILLSMAARDAPGGRGSIRPVRQDQICSRAQAPWGHMALAQPTCLTAWAPSRNWACLSHFSPSDLALKHSHCWGAESLSPFLQAAPMGEAGPICPPGLLEE